MGAPKGPRGPKTKIDHTRTAAVINGVRYPLDELPPASIPHLAVHGLANHLPTKGVNAASVFDTLKAGAVKLVELDADALWREAGALVFAEAATKQAPGKSKINSPGYAENLAFQRAVAAKWTDTQLATAKRVPAIITAHALLSGPAASLDDLAPPPVVSEAA